MEQDKFGEKFLIFEPSELGWANKVLSGEVFSLKYLKYTRRMLKRMLEL
jgi:hypothetical protein